MASFSKRARWTGNDKESANPAIKIEELKILKNRLLLFKLSYPKKIKKYFLSNLFWVEYDHDLHGVSRGILQIPAVSNILPLAWAIGADILVKELDKTYLQSVEKIRLVMKTWYPKLPFSTKIYVDDVTSSNFSNKGYGLLFSGGIDSTTSYVRHKNAKPNLIMVWGADIPLDKKNFWKKARNKYRSFAERENIRINFIKTNMRQFINERLLTIKFGRYLSASWWGRLHHGIGLLGLTAPLTVTEHIGTILIAASVTRTRALKLHWGSHPLIDNAMSWADVKVVHDSDDLSRHEKIRYVLGDYIRKGNYYPTLRVCWSQFSDFNCGTCEKCLRTITALALENIDPNKCGFNINGNFFDILKQNLIENRINIEHAFLWKDIQRHLPKVMNHNLYGCEDFFNWFKEFNIVENKPKRNFNINNLPFHVYYELPENLQKTIKRIREQQTPIMRIAKWVLSLISKL